MFSKGQNCRTERDQKGWPSLVICPTSILRVPDPEAETEVGPESARPLFSLTMSTRTFYRRTLAVSPGDQAMLIISENSADIRGH